MDKDFSDRLKNGQDAGTRPLTKTCSIEDEGKMYKTIKRIFNKYGFDIHDRNAVVGQNITYDEKMWNGISILFSFNTETKKLERAFFIFIDSDESKPKTVPIEVYDELTQELLRKLRCVPNDTGKQLIYCTEFHKIVLK